MLSRVADSLYWMSRYQERAEHLARQLDVHLNLVLDQSAEAAGERRQRLVRCLTADPAPPTIHNDYDLVQHLTFAPSNDNSLVSCVAIARENARQVREQISALTWEKLNALYLMLGQIEMGGIGGGQSHLFFHSINDSIYTIQGLTDSRMSHDQGWHFIRLGQFLERAMLIATWLNSEFQSLYADGRESALKDQQSYLDWVGLLRGCAAFEAYSKVYTAEIQPRHVVEFLLLNPVFPHSIRFSLDIVRLSLDAIASDTGTHKGTRVNRQAGQLCAMLDYAQIDEVLAGGLEHFLQEIQSRCRQIHNTIHQTYIAYSIEEKLAA